MTAQSLIEKATDPENWKDEMLLIEIGKNLNDQCFVESLQNAVEAAGNDPNELIKRYLDLMVEEHKVKLAVPMRRVSSVTEEEAEYLFPEYILKGQINILAGDGGTGKTALWCNAIASLTSGKPSIFDQAANVPFEYGSEQMDAMFFSSEDSVSKVLKGRLRKAGADDSRISFIDPVNEEFQSIKFNSPVLEMIIRVYRPALCVFDPLQSFIPPEIQMGSRNAMRQCLSPLMGLGEKYGTTFLIIMHTNKKQNVWGRTRIADSGDVWDIARSVLIAGTAENGIHYLSHEKNNYGRLAKTILFDVDEKGTTFLGVTEKKDRDFVSECSQAQRPAPARDEAKQTIMDYLHGAGSIESTVFDAEMAACGISNITLRRAKAELKEEHKIHYFCTGSGKERKWFIGLLREGDTR